MSSGSWMIGRPSQLKRYTYFTSQPTRSHAVETRLNASGSLNGTRRTPPSASSTSTIARSVSIRRRTLCGDVIRERGVELCDHVRGLRPGDAKQRVVPAHAACGLRHVAVRDLVGQLRIGG